jgi:hypothetical protein
VCRSGRLLWPHRGRGLVALDLKDVGAGESADSRAVSRRDGVASRGRAARSFGTSQRSSRGVRRTARDALDRLVGSAGGAADRTSVGRSRWSGVRAARARGRGRADRRPWSRPCWRSHRAQWRKCNQAVIGLRPPSARWRSMIRDWKRWSSAAPIASASVKRCPRAAPASSSSVAWAMSRLSIDFQPLRIPRRV